MKNIIVISDLHYDKIKFKSIKNKLAEADFVIFCGDGYDNFITETKEFAHKVVAVRGNCDSVFKLEEKIIQVEDVKILVTHGHGYGVKSGLFSLAEYCKQKDVSVAFFGHTHICADVVHDGVRMINPGAISDFVSPTYYFCTVSGSKLFGKHVEV